MIFCISVMIFWLGSNKEVEPDLQIGPSPVEIEWKLISNFEPDNKLRAVLTLINNGDEAIPAEGWSLYFNSLRILDIDSFPEQFRVSHINGYFFKMEPTEQFEPIAPGEHRDIEYLASFFAIKKSDAPEGFYFVFDDESIETVESVKVHAFETPEQTNRSPNDIFPVPTPEYTFNKNERLKTLDRSEISHITPTPAERTPAEGYFQFSNDIRVYYDQDFESEAQFLADILRDEHDKEVELTHNQESDLQPDIFLMQSGEAGISSEAYQLDVTSGSIKISSSEAPGAFYGVQSLRALIDSRDKDMDSINVVSIADEPAFPYRGMHLDVARNFQSVASVKRLLDIMAQYKLNKFHFHLTDDEGWRIAIDQLPELTEIGGRRGHTESEDYYMIPVYGSGPDPAPAASMGSGWYSRVEYIDILKYAAKRHIEVIPEIDVPGHARAAIIAMERRAKNFDQEGDTISAEKYRLHDPKDQSTYRSVQNYTDNVINVCRESTYRFIDLLIDELVDMHQEAGAPLHMIHMGGDEVPHGAWEKSPLCNTLMQEMDIENVRHLQGYFFGRLSDKLEDRGLKMGGWEEIALREDDDGASEINPDFINTTTPYVWSNIWGGGTEDRAYQLANEGYGVVMSHASNFYFDLAYNKHWQEPGFYWAAMLTTEAPFSFIPFNLLYNASENNYGQPLADNHIDEMVRLNENARKNILGLQGQLWTETVNEEGRMEYMALPRLLGLAERAWAGEPEWSKAQDAEAMEKERLAAWNEFANRLGSLELPRLDQYYDNIQYRIPTPGAIIRDDILHANISLPGFIIRYETDGSEPTMNSPLYTGPVDLNGINRVKLAAFSTTERSGRVVEIKKERE